MPPGVGTHNELPDPLLFSPLITVSFQNSQVINTRYVKKQFTDVHLVNGHLVQGLY